MTYCRLFDVAFDDGSEFEVLYLGSAVVDQSSPCSMTLVRQHGGYGSRMYLTVSWESLRD